MNILSALKSEASKLQKQLNSLNSAIEMLDGNNLPPLTTLVVGKGPGKPGYGIPLDPMKIDEERESVYQYDWFNIYPPSESDLTAAYKKHQNKSGGD